MKTPNRHYSHVHITSKMLEEYGAISIKNEVFVTVMNLLKNIGNHTDISILEMAYNSADAILDKVYSGHAQAGYISIALQVDSTRRQFLCVVSDNGAGILASSSQHKKSNPSAYFGGSGIAEKMLSEIWYWYKRISNTSGSISMLRGEI